MVDSPSRTGGSPDRDAATGTLHLVYSDGHGADDGAPDSNATAAPVQDHFIERDGLRFAGVHLLVDLWGGEGLDNLDLTEAALIAATRAAGATLLHTHLHHFTPNGGISGVLVLAESHISIHTWPERAYAALDIFMCGEADPYKAIPVLRAAFRPTTITVTENKRGMVP
ncbi:adenosylmethionine decarboxylase [Roseospira visakhapatnamensis]|uniref:S-adenosylmethionine decarboxylase proenzyme n=1 Tax=Roseospira visakhapatnamensis TaxID=390880 RepID=A0A7W6RD55_9PROT|nr:adenosylmethionine decarboxylase [Roseospira visakhapatnamensis]MBB4265753.1 S-adenosylmethionine decarboxylase [Roseospira visakhapatnamensis]